MTPGRDDREGDGDGTTTITSRARPDAEPKGEDPAEGGRGSDDDDDDNDVDDDDEDGGALEFIVVRSIIGAAAACGRGYWGRRMDHREDESRRSLFYVHHGGRAGPAVKNYQIPT